MQRKAVLSLQGKILIKHHLSVLVGFYLGAKVIDYFFYDQEVYEKQRELLEDEYWAKHGEPTEIEPKLMQSSCDPSKTRKSWIQVYLEKDMIVKKKDQME